MSSSRRPRFFSALASLASAAPLFRPGTSVPGSSAPLLGAPAPDAPAASRSDRAAIRRALRLSSAEGIGAEVVTACAGGSVLTGWALYLGCSPLLLGLIVALPHLAQFVQMPAAWLTSIGGSKRVALIAVTVSRQALLPLAFLPFLEVSDELRRGMLVFVAGLSAVLGVVGNNAWVAWMGDLVPQRIRGRYFGRRTALCTFGGTLASLAAGLFLDRAHGVGPTREVLAILALVACLAGAFTSYLLSLQHDPNGGEKRSGPVDVRSALVPWTQPQARRFLSYQLAWNAAVGLSGGFFAMHMLQNLKMGFTLMALYSAAVAAVRMLTAPLWGRALDRVGAQPVLVVCSFGIAVLPALWIFPTPHSLWPIAIDVVLSGVLWGGHGLAAFALPLAVAPRHGRPFYLAAFAATGGLAFTVASTGAGWLTQTLPENLVLLGRPLIGLHVVFLLSSLARAVAALLALRVVEAGARRPEDLLYLMRSRVRRVVPALVDASRRRSPERR